MSVTFSKIQFSLCRMACLLAVTVGTAQAQEAQESGLSGGFTGAFFFSQSTGPDGVVRMEWFGSILIWVLLLLSISGIGLLVNLALSNGRKTIAPPERMAQIEDLIRTDRWEDALNYTRVGESDFDQMAHAGLSEAPNGHQAMESKVFQSASELASERFRRVEPLNVLGQVAPMIGLFGTVYGMIVAFGSIVASGGNADPVALAGGIGTALVTTFWGLLVAIPALAGYATIRNRIDALNGQAEMHVLDMLERFKPKHDTSPSKAESDRES